MKRLFVFTKTETFVLFLVFASFCSLFFFVLANSNRFSYTVDYLKSGDLADEDVVMNRRIKFIDGEATARLKTAARNDSRGVYYRNDSKVIQNIFKLRKDKEANPSESEAFGALEDMLNEIYKIGYYDFDELMKDNRADIESDGVVVDKVDLLTSANIYDYIDENYGFLPDYVFARRNIGKYLQPNMLYDLAASVSAADRAASAVEPVAIEMDKGEVIIMKDEVVTREKLDILEKIREYESGYDLFRILLALVASAVAIYMVFFVLKRVIFHNRTRCGQYVVISGVSELVFVCITFATYYLMSVSASDLYAYDARSVAFLPPMFVSAATSDKRSGYALMGLNIALLMLLPYVTLVSVIKTSLICVIAINLFNTGVDRNGIIVRWLLISVSLFVIVVSLDFSFYAKDSFVFVDALLEAAKFTFFYVICFVTMSFLENALNFPTAYKLNQLIYFSNSLLDKFKSACPGSYEHAETVADIADAAAIAIGADHLLVRAAARYHDVGKSEHPEYFVENQKGNSKHDAINSKLSATIIKSHVTLGVKMLRESEIGIPEEVVKIVSEHHGNDLISFFYYEAQKEFSMEQIDRELFSYSSSSPPTSKESAILMLCDISEAAYRSAKRDFGEDELRKFLHKITLSKIDNGQLDKSGLSIGELRAVEDSIVKSLKDKSHKRIEYPGQKPPRPEGPEPQGAGEV